MITQQGAQRGGGLITQQGATTGGGGGLRGVMTTSVEGVCDSTAGGHNRGVGWGGVITQQGATTGGGGA